MRRQVTLAELLRQGDYDVFYQAMHRLSEIWLMLLNVPSTTCQLAGALMGQHGAYLISLDATVEPDLQPLVKKFDVLRDRLVKFQNDLRCLLWAGGCVDGRYAPSKDSTARTEAINRERWQPYDEAAWDGFFQQIATLLSPALAVFDGIAAALREMLGLMPTEGDERIERMREFAAERSLTLPSEKVKFQSNLNPAGIKAELWWTED